MRSCLAALATIAALGAGAGAAPARQASPDVVLDWNAIALATVLAERPQPQSAVYLGLAHAALYDAVIAIEGGYDPYLIVPGVPPGASPEAAAVAAAHGVLVEYFPAQAATLDAAYAESLAGIADGPAEDRGVLVGRQVAAGIVAARIDDGRDAPFPFQPVPAPGVWRPTPPAFLPALHPWLAAVRPLLIERPAQFRPGPPPPLASRRYARDFEEIRRYGGLNESRRTPAQTETALFWTEPPAPQYNRTLRDLVVTRGLALREAARALAMTHTTIADAVIACWDAKHAHAFWRPVTAIHEAATDGNDRTEPDPTWEPLLPTPNHPEYPSAHTCATAALGEVVAELVATRKIRLDIRSAVTGTVRRFSRVADLERDVIDARVYVGYHWRVSGEVGYRLGQKVARWALHRYFDAEP
jgi:PAP2 superfamily